PNQSQRKEIKEYLNIKEELDGQRLIQKLIDENLKWQLTLELQKPQLISMEAYHLFNKMVYVTGYHINLLEPYLVTKEQHEKITEKITHKINKYLKEIHCELSQQTKTDLMDILQQVKKKMTFK